MIFYKETIFKEALIGMIPSEWEFVELDNLIDIETGKRMKGGGLVEGDVPSIGGEHIDKSGNIVWKNLKFIVENFYDDLKQGKVKLKDILLVKDGATTGKVALVKNLLYPKVAINEHVFIIRSKSTNKLLNEFLFYLLFSRIGQSQIKHRFHGIIGGIIRGELKTIRIPLPTLQEQQKIAEILSTVDENIQKVDEIILKTKKLKKGLIQELLSKGIGHKEFKETEIGRIPKSWEVFKLGNKNVAIIIMGQSPPSSTYNEEGNGLPFLQGKAEFGEIFPSPVIYCSKPMKIAEKNDILLSVRAPVGDVNIAPFKCCIGRGLSSLRAKSEKLHYLFLFYYLIFSNKRFESLSMGSTFKAIRKGEIQNYKIPLPPLSEQQEIAEILTTADKKLELERNEKIKLERIKQGLMDLLLTGKIRVRP